MSSIKDQMKRKPYSYRYAVKISCATHGNDAALTRILRKLVREAVIAAYAYDGYVHVQEARAHQIARKLVP